MISDIKKIDIRFIPIDSRNPYALQERFSEENMQKITEELHARLGHLCDDITRSNGHIRVYTQGNSIVGQPQFVNFSKEVWDKIYHTHSYIADADMSQASSVTDDYLDHENYNDI